MADGEILDKAKFHTMVESTKEDWAAIGRAGAINAALLAVSILALGDTDLLRRLEEFRAAQTASVAARPSDADPTVGT